MTAIKLGASMTRHDVATHQAWLFASARDIELQDFVDPRVLAGEWRATVMAARVALAGHKGRRSTQGPAWRVDAGQRDAVWARDTVRRLIVALDAADAVGACQMVLLSPFDGWYRAHVQPDLGADSRYMAHVGAIMDPVVTRAEDLGITIVIQNNGDADPTARRRLVEDFDSGALRLSVGTGPLEARQVLSGEPLAERFARDAGPLLEHLHLHDLGPAEQPGTKMPMRAGLLSAVMNSDKSPRVVLELRAKQALPPDLERFQTLGLLE